MAAGRVCKIPGSDSGSKIFLAAIALSEQYVRNGFAISVAWM